MSDPTPKQWTLMFYFASDNPLAPSIVSQLKAIKDAGFHKQVNVVAHFDPHTPLTPTHIFDVNYVEKMKATEDSHIGFDANDPFVRTLVGDKLWSKERDRTNELIRNRLKEKFKREGGFEYDPPEPNVPDVLPDCDERKAQKVCKKEEMTDQPHTEANPTQSLDDFLNFCGQKYPARHYMLFILGHGIVVGNDLFLYDEHSDKEHALKLTVLEGILRKFEKQIHEFGKFELLSFHSCSMSSLEVAYQLAGTAKYMLASQGPAFVGSWPYRQILIKVFNHVKKYLANEEQLDVDDVVKKIFAYCFYNSYDYQMAGYSFDVSLVDLRRVREQGIKTALIGLTAALTAGLPDAPNTNACTQGKHDEWKIAPANLARDLIILSHWEAQSYYEENFTDLCDFCFCLYRRCVAAEKAFPDSIPQTVQTIRDECLKVLNAFGYEKPRTREDDAHEQSDQSAGSYGRKNRTSPVTRSGFAGPGNQYSCGLSMFFPWSPPQDNEMWDTQYAGYQLSIDTKECWKTFLDEYFKKTMRKTQGYEKTEAGWYVHELNDQGKLLEDIGGLMFNEFGQLKDRPRDITDKDRKTDPTGGDCVCPSIKNYPPTTTHSPGSGDMLNRMEIR